MQEKLSAKLSKIVQITNTEYICYWSTSVINYWQMGDTFLREDFGRGSRSKSWDWSRIGARWWQGQKLKTGWAKLDEEGNKDLRRLKQKRAERGCRCTWKKPLLKTNWTDYTWVSTFLCFLANRFETYWHNLYLAPSKRSTTTFSSGIYFKSHKTRPAI